MSSLVPSITIAQLTPGPAFDNRTITFWLQLAFSAGYYTVGGVPAGIAAYVNSQTVDTNNFLWADIHGEDPVTSSPSVGGVYYKYNPTNDTIQMFVNGVEFTASEAIPASVLNDTIVGQFKYSRSGL